MDRQWRENLAGESGPEGEEGMKKQKPLKKIIPNVTEKPNPSGRKTEVIQITVSVDSDLFDLVKRTIIDRICDRKFSLMGRNPPQGTS
jgi:hypothetical protein